MAEEKDHITNSEDYQKYLENRMSPEERHAFEKRMLEDDFEAEALEGFEQLTPEEVHSDLNQLRDDLNKRTKNRSGFYYWRAAAAILLLGVFSFIIYLVLDQNSKTEITQNKEIAPEEQSEVVTEQPLPQIKDSITDETEPTIAYNRRLEEKESQIEETETLPKNGETLIEGIQLDEDNVMEAKELEDEINEDDIIHQDQLAPVETPSMAYEAEKETAEEAAPLAAPILKKSMQRSAPPSAIQEDINLAPEMARAAAPEVLKNTRTITGKIISEEDDESIPGVNVILKGTTVGTVSDMEGNYSIEVPKEDDITLVYSSVGFNSEEIKVGEESQIDVNLNPDVSSLSEIVVVGYGVSGEDSETEYAFTPPTPEGGKNAFKDYIRENIKYPGKIEDPVKGTVRLKFTVKTNGEIANLEILKSLGENFDQEAIRLVNEGPEWKPAELNGKKVERDVKVKIRFRPPE